MAPVLRSWLSTLLVALSLAGCTASPPPAAAPPQGSPAINRIAESYVKLVLAVGQHEPDYVDAYYGPPEWRTEAEARKRPLDEIRSGAVALLSDLQARPPAGGGDDAEMVRLRHEYLTRQLQSMVARLDLLSGKRMSFDEESRALYDAVAPTRSAEYFQDVIDQLDALLPGEGPVVEQLERFRAGFVIPKDRLDQVFQAAIAECRRRTLEHIELPAGESFEVEYVTDKPWSAYNWYKGDFHSLIQVNTDLPIHIESAIDLACHEGYPGHHVYNALLEKHLVRDRGWPEFSVYALFSPQSLIAEGTANYGIEVAFPGEERVEFERKTLFPLAGLDPAEADRYHQALRLGLKMVYAGNEAARGYLDGKLTKEQAIDWMARYSLTPRNRAEQRLRFIERYRSYVINYNLGRDLVKEYIERRGGDRWEEFEKLLSSPRLPSGLR